MSDNIDLTGESDDSEGEDFDIDPDATLFVNKMGVAIGTATYEGVERETVFMSCAGVDNTLDPCEVTIAITKAHIADVIDMLKRISGLE